MNEWKHTLYCRELIPRHSAISEILLFRECPPIDKEASICKVSLCVESAFSEFFEAATVIFHAGSYAAFTYSIESMEDCGSLAKHEYKLECPYILNSKLHFTIQIKFQKIGLLDTDILVYCDLDVKF